VTATGGPTAPASALRGLSAATLRVGSMGLTFVATVWLARTFSVAEFGAYALALLAVFVGATVVSVGAGRVGLRRVTGLLVDERKKDADALVRSVLPLFVVTGPVGGLIATAMCVLITPRALVPIGSCLVVGVASVGAGVLLVGTDLLRAQGRQVWADAISGRNGFLPSLLLLVMLVPVPSAGLSYVLWAQMLAFLLPALPVLWWLGRHRPGRAHLGVREWIGRGQVFMWTSLATLTNGMADVLVAGIVLAGDDVGRYAAAVRLTSLVALPQLVAQMTLVVETSRLLHQGRTRELEQRLRRTSTLLLGLCAPVLLALVAPRLVLREVFGSGYESGASALVALSIAQLVNVATGLTGIVLSMSGNERVTLRALVVAGAATVSLGWLAGQHFGSAGLAIASATASGSMFVFLLFATRRRVGIWAHPAILPPWAHRMRRSAG
jgi:O-antigen/teichoic acid export membrane protein